MTHRVDLPTPSQFEASGSGSTVVLNIVESLEMLILTAKGRGLPAVALSLRLVLADVTADAAAPK